MCFLFLGDAMKNRWRNLRENYRKETNKLKTKTGQAASEKVTVKWPLFESLDFLKDQFKPRPMVSNMCPSTAKEDVVIHGDTNVSGSEIIVPQIEQEEFQNDESIPDDDSINKSTGNQADHLSYQRPKQFKRSVMEKLVQLEERKVAEYERKKREDVTDADYHFLMSLLPSLKKVTDERKLTVKRKLMDVLFEEELMYQHQPSTSTSVSYNSSRPSSAASSTQLPKPSPHHTHDSPESRKTFYELQAVQGSNEDMEELGTFFQSFNPNNKHQ